MLKQVSVVAEDTPLSRSLADRWGGEWQLVSRDALHGTIISMPHDVSVIVDNPHLANLVLGSKMVLLVYTGEDSEIRTCSRTTELATYTVVTLLRDLSLKELAYEEVSCRNDNPEALFWYFVRHSDIFAARELARRQEHDCVWANTGLAYLDRHYGFIWAGPEAYAAHYQKVGAGFQGNWEDHTQHGRYKQMVQWLGEKKPRRILDFGCAYGFIAMPLASDLGAHVVGYDLDKKAHEYAQRQSRSMRADCEFRLGDSSDVIGVYDAAIVGEILEHVPDPVQTLTEIESRVREGGLVVGSVPFGPIEHLDYREDSTRAHVREIEWHDLIDMLGQKPGFRVAVHSAGMSWLTGEPVGWYVFSYETDYAEVGQIDMERKLRYQRIR